MKLFERDDPSVGSVLYRGTVRPRAEEFSFLKKHGITLGPGMPGEGGLAWSLRLSHREWGEADLLCPHEPPMPNGYAVEFANGLSPAERKECKAAGTAVLVHCKATRKHVPSDRKRMLRYARAVMGDHALCVLDHGSDAFWSRAGLDEELAHDADLDIQSLFSVHAVADPTGQRVHWLHTHGLDKLGAFDFDILNPGEDIMVHDSEVVRAIAFMIASGVPQEGERRVPLGSPGGDLWFVPAAEFQERAAERFTRIRNEPEHHTRKRVVLCDPGLPVRGYKPHPSRFLSRSLEGCRLHITKEATDLMAARARASLPLLQRLREEFAEFPLQVVAKIGYETDTGPDENENGGVTVMWFDVHGIEGDSLDATLVSEPFDISRLKVGDRGRHPVERLADWMIVTPLGDITPRTQLPARILRENREEILRVIRSGGGLPEGAADLAG